MNIGNVKYWLVWSFIVGTAVTGVSTLVNTEVSAQYNSTEEWGNSTGNLTSGDSGINATLDDSGSGNISAITGGAGF